MSGSGTERQRIAALLAAAETDLRGISQRLGIPEKAAAEHLVHMARSAAARGQRLEVTPARCLACGRVFAKRRRLTAPGRCPRCRSERITAPRYRLTR